MRVLLDECVPRALREDLLGHDVTTGVETGWAGVKNGELLRLAANDFDVLVTVDRNLEYQQTFSRLALAVIVVHALSNLISTEIQPSQLNHGAKSLPYGAMRCAYCALHG